MWALIHIVPDIQNHQAADWILWHRLGTVLLRILVVWAYNNTCKSVFSAILFHTANNVSWAMFPNYGSHYNPLITSLFLCLAATIVIFGWGSETLARYRFGRPGGVVSGRFLRR